MLFDIRPPMRDAMKGFCYSNFKLIRQLPALSYHRHANRNIMKATTGCRVTSQLQSRNNYYCRQMLEGNVFILSVCLSVCLSVSWDYNF